MHERISFLLGSSESFPACFPSVEKLTNIVLTGTGIEIVGSVITLIRVFILKIFDSLKIST